MATKFETPTLGSKTANINVKQFKTHCKDDVMISLH